MISVLPSRLLPFVFVVIPGLLCAHLLPNHYVRRGLYSSVDHVVTNFPDQPFVAEGDAQFLLKMLGGEGQLASEDRERLYQIVSNGKTGSGCAIAVLVDRGEMTDLSSVPAGHPSRHLAAILLRMSGTEVPWPELAPQLHRYAELDSGIIADPGLLVGLTVATRYYGCAETMGFRKEAARHFLTLGIAPEARAEHLGVWGPEMPAFDDIPAMILSDGSEDCASLASDVVANVGSFVAPTLDSPRTPSRRGQPIPVESTMPFVRLWFEEWSRVTAGDTQATVALAKAAESLDGDVAQLQSELEAPEPEPSETEELLWGSGYPKPETHAVMQWRHDKFVATSALLKELLAARVAAEAATPPPAGAGS
ncbi:hypothetical protein HZA57_04050 [Candidatus Poribacteria bacterium]|nr:hypothetical protein [Candidatus Poribacteria bacterium]